jgi:hypothetical protein
MDTQTFVDRCATGIRTKSGHLNHRIIFDGRDLFSYGTHYPLLIDLGGGLRALNIQGYSNTTAKHINACRAYAQIKVCITNPPFYCGAGDGSGYKFDDIRQEYTPKRREAVRWFLHKERKELEAKLAKLTSRATRQIPRIKSRLEMIEKHLEALKLYK